MCKQGSFELLQQLRRRTKIYPHPLSNPSIEKKYSNDGYSVSSDAIFKLQYASKNGHKSKSCNINKLIKTITYK